MDLLQASRISATGLTAQRTKMKIIAENLANAETTRTPQGGPYRRQLVVLSEKAGSGFQGILGRLQDRESGVEVTEIIPSADDYRLVSSIYLNCSGLLAKRKYWYVIVMFSWLLLIYGPMVQKKAN